MVLGIAHVSQQHITARGMFAVTWWVWRTLRPAWKKSAAWSSVCFVPEGVPSPVLFVGTPMEFTYTVWLMVFNDLWISTMSGMVIPNDNYKMGSNHRFEDISTINPILIRFAFLIWRDLPVLAAYIGFVVIEQMTHWDPELYDRHWSVSGILSCGGWLRNPAPVDRWFIPLSIGFQVSTIQGDAGFLPSTVC